MLENDVLYLVWKNPETRDNFLIGKLTHAEKFRFEYLGESVNAEESGWRKLDAFPERCIYESYIMFPVFSSRLPDRKRRDIDDILQKYGLKEFDEFELLRRSGARLPIDTYSFIDPILDENEVINREFYVAGTRHYADCKGTDCSMPPETNIGDSLKLVEEPENTHDPDAVKVLTQSDKLLGYIPRYYSKTIRGRMRKGLTYSCTVVEINPARNCSECVKIKLCMPENVN